MADTTLINNVSDTSLWVAYYRAEESKRTDPLFKDLLAEKLAGERGKKIAEDMKDSSRYSEWTVVLRTVVIDAYIEKIVSEGIDTIINLGAGLDTRPYRMKLPSNLNWIEVDYPTIVTMKNNQLKNERPKCGLSRVGLDLSDAQKRKDFLQQAATESTKIAVLTEGVVLYLTEEQVSDLATDLHSFSSIRYWIVEYMSSSAYPLMKAALKKRKLKNAPFQFFPEDWIEFFRRRNWELKEIRYLGDVGAAVGRPMPTPWYGPIYKLFLPAAKLEKAKKLTGFILFERKD
jgi:methyltransferase (TIGR00027 family)